MMVFNSNIYYYKITSSKLPPFLPTRWAFAVQHPRWKPTTTPSTSIAHPHRPTTRWQLLYRTQYGNRRQRRPPRRRGARIG